MTERIKKKPHTHAWKTDRHTYTIYIYIYTNTHTATRDTLQKEDTHRLKVKEWKQTHHANENKMKAAVAILI